MGSLRYAILGMLNRTDLTGYDMTKEFETTLFDLWRAKHSQIYPELKSLTEAGLVDFKVEISGNVLQKKVYSITKKGREEFQTWLESCKDMAPVPKDEMRLQLFFSDCLTPEKRHRLLMYHLEQHQNKLAYLKAKQKKFSTIPPQAEKEFSDYMVLVGGIMREQSICDWLLECIRLCEIRAKQTEEQ